MEFSTGMTILTVTVGILSVLFLLAIAFIGYNYFAFEKKMKAFVKSEMDVFRMENRQEMYAQMSQKSMQDCMINQKLGHQLLADSNMVNILYYSDLSGKDDITGLMIGIMKDDLIRAESRLYGDNRAILISVLHKFRKSSDDAKEIEDIYLKYSYKDN